MEKQQQHGISFMTMTGTKYSHGPTNEFRYMDNAAAGSLFTWKENTKIHSLAIHNPFTDTGKAAISLWSTLTTGQIHTQHSQLLAAQYNGKMTPMTTAWLQPHGNWDGIDTW
jgi:hypothetical protein